MEIKVRLDIWLWAARFFKTRSLATHAVNGGKVHCNGERVKPAKIVRTGDELRIKRDLYEFVVVVRDLNNKRRPAKEAEALYEETDASVQARLRQIEERRIMRNDDLKRIPDRRPNKRERRLIRSFTGK